MNRVAQRVGGAPFGDVNGQIRFAASGQDRLLAQGVARRHEEIFAQIQKRIALGIHPAGAAAEAVAVAGDEINRRIAGDAEFEERFDPFRAGPGVAANEVISIHTFDGLGGVVIKLEVFFAATPRIARPPESEIIRLVPEFKITFHHFVRVVAFRPVRDEVVDEAVPFLSGRFSDVGRHS